MVHRELGLLVLVVAVAAVAYNLWNMQKSGITAQTFLTNTNGPGLEDLALGIGLALIAFIFLQA